MVHIEATVGQVRDNPAIVRARPDMYRLFWPDVRGSYFFRNRRDFLDFMCLEGSAIYYVPDGPRAGTPFIMVGNWRSRTDITALWHVKGEGGLKRRLVTEAAHRSFLAGSASFVTRPLTEYEAGEFGEWGFDTAYRIVLLEKNIRAESARGGGSEGLQIVRYRKKFMEEVLSLDAAAFDYFWKLDERTLETVATSCSRNAFICARRGGRTLGYAVGGANGRFGYLQRLGVDPVNQGKGIGEALVDGILRILRVMGAISIMVNTQADNAAALRLYRKLGFEEMPDRRFIMHGTPSSMEPGR